MDLGTQDTCHTMDLKERWEGRGRGGEGEVGRRGEEEWGGGGELFSYVLSMDTIIYCDAVIP